MRSVWSFWSKPFQTYYSNAWFKPLHHLLAWGLSVRTAGRYYPETVLVTDLAGKDLLVDRLGLPFVHVSTELEQLSSTDPGWWALGKLIAYSIQNQPFVHLDADVFLWKPLPGHLLNAAVFTQNEESHTQNGFYYHPELVEQVFAKQSLKLPVEWEWTRSNRTQLPVEVCGIFGGSHTAFIRHYSQTAIDLIQREENAAAWSLLSFKQNLNIVLEQFFLAACVKFHGEHRASPFNSVRIEHLFPSSEAPYDPNHAARLGFTHLIAGGKAHPSVARRLEERLWREAPLTSAAAKERWPAKPQTAALSRGLQDQSRLFSIAAALGMQKRRGSLIGRPFDLCIYLIFSGLQKLHSKTW